MTEKIDDGLDAEQKHRRYLRRKLRKWISYMDAKMQEQWEQDAHKRHWEELMEQARENGFG